MTRFCTLLGYGIVGGLIALGAGCGDDVQQRAGVGGDGATISTDASDGALGDAANSADTAVDSDDTSPSDTSQHDTAASADADSGTNDTHPLMTCATDADCAGLDDGNLCNGTVRCDNKQQPAICAMDASTIVKCPDDGTACRIPSCDAQTGACSMAPLNDGTPCDDGDACQADDACAAGKCTGTLQVCPCVGDADCGPHEDGKACNGTLYCDKSSSPTACRVNLATVVMCSPLSDTDCSKNTCSEPNGTCAMVHVPDQHKCDDGDACTGSDACYAGSCVSGQNTCACIKSADCAKYEDGDACNGTLYCDLGGKEPRCRVNPATVKTCPVSDDPCVVAGCNKTDGVCMAVAATQATACSDGNPCTSEGCDGGSCVADANLCVCTNDTDCAASDPADKCRGPMYCDKSVAGKFRCAFNPAAAVVCASNLDTDCTRNICDATTGKCAYAPVADNSLCNADGNTCTPGDRCQKGACQLSQNVCKCQLDGDCAQFEDGDLCNGTLYCDATADEPVCVVKPASVVACDPTSDTICTVARCAPKTGKCAPQAVNQGAGCNADDDACTAHDACSNGACVAGANACACTETTDCGAHEDGNVCNGTLYCDKAKQPFVCSVNPATIPDCSTLPAKVCQLALCDAKAGCKIVAAQDNSPCDDGQPCTVGDTCAAGQCQPGSNLCGCDPSKGKTKACADIPGQNDCDGWLQCKQIGAFHQCVLPPGGAVVCPDLGVPCFKLACDPDDGLCSQVPDPVQSGKVCDDGNVCTVAGTSSCTASGCFGGKVMNCDDGNACTHEFCSAIDGCTTYPLSNTPCDDGNSCTVNDGCAAGKCAAGEAALGKACTKADSTSGKCTAAGQCT